MNELSDEFSPRTEDRSRSPLPIFGLHRGGFGLHRGPGSINSYIQNYKDYYAPPRKPKEPESKFFLQNLDFSKMFIFPKFGLFQNLDFPKF